MEGFWFVPRMCLWVHKSCTSSPVPGILASCRSLNSQSLLHFWDHKHSFFCHWAVWTSAQMLPLHSSFLNTSPRGQHPTHRCIAHFFFVVLSIACLDGACLFICYCLPQLSCEQGVPRQTPSPVPWWAPQTAAEWKRLSRPPVTWWAQVPQWWMGSSRKEAVASGAIHFPWVAKLDRHWKKNCFALSLMGLGGESTCLHVLKCHFSGISF